MSSRLALQGPMKAIHMAGVSSAGTNQVGLQRAHQALLSYVLLNYARSRLYDDVVELILFMTGLLIDKDSHIPTLQEQGS